MLDENNPFELSPAEIVEKAIICTMDVLFCNRSNVETVVLKFRDTETLVLGALSSEETVVISETLYEGRIYILNVPLWITCEDDKLTVLVLGILNPKETSVEDEIECIKDVVKGTLGKDDLNVLFSDTPTLVLVT